jgi:hypothetical protein
MRPRLIERMGRRLRFSPEGRRVRVWVEGWPGEEDSRVLDATVVGVSDGVALLELETGERARVVPREAGFGLYALWFSFIAVDATSADTGEPLGRWAIRLGSRA